MPARREPAERGPKGSVEQNYLTKAELASGKRHFSIIDALHTLDLKPSKARPILKRIALERHAAGKLEGGSAATHAAEMLRYYAGLRKERKGK